MKDNLTRFCVILLLLTVGFLLTGCKTIDESQEKQKMGARLSLYGKTVRWGALENLYAFLTPEEAAKAVIQQNLGNIRVTDYQVQIPPHKIDEYRLSQTAMVEYLFRDTQSVKTLSDSQVWEYNTELKEWFRANPIPRFE